MRCDTNCIKDADRSWCSRCLCLLCGLCAGDEATRCKAGCRRPLCGDCFGAYDKTCGKCIKRHRSLEKQTSPGGESRDGDSARHEARRVVFKQPRSVDPEKKERKADSGATSSVQIESSTADGGAKSLSSAKIESSSAVPIRRIPRIMTSYSPSTAADLASIPNSFSSLPSRRYVPSSPSYAPIPCSLSSLSS